MTCNSCTWFVEETDIIGDYSHEDAVKLGKGFCLIKDLFTHAEASQQPLPEGRGLQKLKNTYS